MAVEIGIKGLEEVNLTIPQGATLAFTIVHKDEDGHYVDHSASTIVMAFQSKYGKTTTGTSQFCTGTETGISVMLPASFTETLPKGKLVWDIFATIQDGPTFRMAYGTVTVVDTYALDEGE